MYDNTDYLFQENDEWQLRAGALVLADNGICCIDEFNQMKQQDRVNLHEAMEQQTISVAKANITCKLNTKCSIIAATNSNIKRNRYANTDFHSPLLSRFDLVLPIIDSINHDRDSEIADHVLNDIDLNTSHEDDQLWTLDKLKVLHLIYFELLTTYFSIF